MSTPNKKAAGNSSPSIDPDQMLLLDNQLCFAMYSASLAMTKSYKKLLKALDLTYPQYLVMMVLWEQDGVIVSELGKRLYLDSGTLTPLLKRMETMGLLHRQRDTDDERRVAVKLSDAGRALKRKAQAVPEKVACLLPEMSKIVAMRDDLHALRDNLQDKLEE
ncbi:MarR family transcriptional regulator [Oxalobacteraceae bacterium CAVE-383]|nr:MarR family transcriptional regulator [Oxalobacteraceae bacterium CAVE-383]